jgi:uncharacterized protein (TIGR02117 family)
MVYVTRRHPFFSFALFLFLLIPLCAAVSTAIWKCDSDARNCHSVHIVRSAWHAGLVLRKGDIAAKTVPELSDFAGAEMIEFSWGDRDYFPDPSAGVFAALRAAFWSGGSVLHLVGFRGKVEDLYFGAEITELRMSKDAFDRLVTFLASEFARTDPSLPAKPRPGLYPHSRFYGATRKFSLTRTCNTWVAEALNFAGMPINPGLVITAGNLNDQLADLPEYK